MKEFWANSVGYMANDSYTYSIGISSTHSTRDPNQHSTVFLFFHQTLLVTLFPSRVESIIM